MNEPHQSWQSARFIQPDQIDTEQEPAPSFTPATELPPEHTSIVNDLPTAEEPNNIPGQAPPKRFIGKVFTSCIAILLTSAAGMELYRLLDWSFEFHTWAGMAVSILVVLTLVSGIWQLRKSLAGLKQLREAEHLRQEAETLQQEHTHGHAAQLLNKLEQHYKYHPQGQEVLQNIHHIDSTYNDTEIVHFLSKHALQQQDLQARHCIQRHSIEAGVLVAISPWASFDMLLAGWRNFRMLKEIMSIYGIAPSAVAQIKLLRKVLHSIAFAGLSDMAMDAGSTLLGTSVMAGLSARAGQGLGAGLFTARTGLTAMELCRPLPDNQQRTPLLKSIANELLRKISGTRD